MTTAPTYEGWLDDFTAAYRAAGPTDTSTAMSHLNCLVHMSHLMNPSLDDVVIGEARAVLTHLATSE